MSATPLPAAACVPAVATVPAGVWTEVLAELSVADPRFAGDVRLTLLKQDTGLSLYRVSFANGKPRLLAFALAMAGTASAAARRIECEYGWRAKIGGAWGVRPRYLLVSRHARALLLDDPGGMLLGAMGVPMMLDAALRTAIALTRAIGGLHAASLVHRDVKPDNVFVTTTGEVRLTGLGIASLASVVMPTAMAMTQAHAPAGMVEGTLAYMAPEQTGRTNRSVDARADLYALGVTLYALFTGSLPFTASEPAAWVHCHVARRPVPPSERQAGVPEQVSHIVMKLLEKAAEDRYQTSEGLAADLQRCLDGLLSRGEVPAFSLGDADRTARLVLPDRLYGRDREVAALGDAYRQVVTTGAPALVLISGYSGVGKSAVVEAFQRTLPPARPHASEPRRLFFASGKFDQYVRDIPYATLSQCFVALLTDVLVASPEARAAWRDALREALGQHGQLIVNLVPMLEEIIGKQPAVATLGAAQEHARFQSVLRRFLSVFARAAHPLIFFLDDLQWLDGATLAFLEDIATRRDIDHLLLIGAYRDNEVDDAHPLAHVVQAIESAGTAVRHLALAPLTAPSLAALVGEALHCDEPAAAPLARLLLEKTGGNPFFTIQLLLTLADQHQLRLDAATSSWSWNLDAIRASDYSENVVDLMVGKLRELKPHSQHALATLACLGSGARATTLASAMAEPVGSADAALASAIAAALVRKQGDRYAFSHDKVQEAAYALIAPARRGAAHLDIARRLLADAPPERLPDVAFEIANHFLRALDLVDASDEQRQVARLMLLAGKKAKAASAYASALTFLAAGDLLMGRQPACAQAADVADVAARGAGGEDNAGDGAGRPAVAADMVATNDLNEARGSGCTIMDDASFYALRFTLASLRAECEFLTGRLGEAEARLARIAGEARTLRDRATVAWLRVTLYTALDRSALAIETGLAFLRQAGIPWEAHPSRADARIEYEALMAEIGPRDIAGLAALPTLADPRQAAVLDVLTSVLPPAFFSNEDLVCLILCRMARLSLRHGNADASALAYAYLGMVVGPCFGDYPVAYAFGRLGHDLVETRGMDRYRARVYMTFAYHVMPWTRPYRAGDALLRRAFDVALDAGDLTYAGFSSCTLVTTLLASGTPLDQVEREASAKLAYVAQARFGLIVDIVTVQRQLVRALRGDTLGLGQFDDDTFSEREFELHLRGNRSLDIAACWYWIRKTQCRVVALDFPAALAAARQAEPLLWSTSGHLELAVYHAFAGLAHAGCHALADPDDHAAAAGHRTALAGHLRQMQVWAGHCRANFGGRAALLAAELARIDGNVAEAMQHYDEAIRVSRESGFTHDEALAYEWAARCQVGQGLGSMADALLKEAIRCYGEWGAQAKQRELARGRPDLVQIQQPRPRDETATVVTSIDALDLESIVKSLHSVSGETALARVIDKLMVIALEQAGAERGVLMLPAGDGLRRRAEARVGQTGIAVVQLDLGVAPHDVPLSMVQAVLRTRDHVVVEDAQTRNPFDADTYFQAGTFRSVLCLPLLRQAEVLGVLYLENGLISNAFTPARGAVLRLLASTAAISIENASLDEKTALLKEVHHRVKNNLQLISSLLSLQASHIEDPSIARLFAESRDRVRSMALVHENLYRAGNFARVEMSAHLRNLCSQLLRAYRTPYQAIDIRVEASAVEMDMNRAVTCGLIVNELVSNALKHAFPDGRDGADGRIDVDLARHETGHCTIRVRDNGVGLAGEGAPRRAGAMGLDLVDDLVAQLRGTLSVSHVGGTAYTIDFPLPGQEH